MIDLNKYKNGLGYSEAVFVWACALVPLTHPFSNSFMRDLDTIWELKRVIPYP